MRRCPSVFSCEGDERTGEGAFRARERVSEAAQEQDQDQDQDQIASE